MADPFAIIAQGNADMNQAATRESMMAQNALMQMFEMEARRQAPYVEMPAQLAMANIGGEQQLQRSIAGAEAKAQIKRRYGGKQKKEDDEVDTGNGTAPSADGSGEYETVTLPNGKSYQVPKKKAE